MIKSNIIGYKWEKNKRGKSNSDKNLFIYSLVKRLLSTCSVLRTESSSRDTEVNNTEADHSLPRKKNKQTWSDKRIVRNMQQTCRKSLLPKTRREE